MSDARRLSISVDSAETVALLDELNALMDQSPDWLRWLAAEVLQHLDEGVHLTAIDGDQSAAPATSDLRVLAKPAHKLVLLVAALRAGNGQGGVLVDFDVEHGGLLGAVADSGVGNVAQGACNANAENPRHGDSHV